MSNLPDKRLDEILRHYKEYVTGVYQGSSDYDEATAKLAIQSTSTTAQQQLLAGIMEQLPKQKPDMLNGKALVHQTWYNNAIRDVVSVIQKYMDKEAPPTQPKPDDKYKLEGDYRP